MDWIKILVLVFSLAGVIDLIIGNRLGLGKEFQKALSLFGPMAMSMLGMLVLAQAIAQWLSPVFIWFYNAFGLDPSIIPASLIANDMGGAYIAMTVCRSDALGNYNAFVISSMMGCTISYTIPVGMGMVRKENHKEFFFGLLCGIATIPVGSFVAGVMCGLDLTTLLFNLLPLVILAVIVGVALVFAPRICIRCFGVFGVFMKTLAMIGLGCGIFTFLTDIQISPWMQSFENAAFICVNACVTLSGMLPLVAVLSKVLQKPLNWLGNKAGINGKATLGLLGSLATATPVLGFMDEMDKKGIVLNAAFATSGAFVFGAHIAYTMAIDGQYVAPMIVGKLISGVAAIALALLLYKNKD